MIYQLRQEVNYIKEVLAGSPVFRQLPHRSAVSSEPDFAPGAEDQGTVDAHDAGGVDPVIKAMTFTPGSRPGQPDYYRQSQEPDEQENADLSNQIQDLEQQLQQAHGQGSGSGSGAGGGTGTGDLSDGIQVGDLAGYNGQYYYDSWGKRPAGSNFAGQANAVRIDACDRRIAR